MKKINNKIKTFWGISEVGFSVMSTTETSFFVFFLTDVAQLPLSITAVITSFTALADAVTAVIAGIIIDKVTFKNGKYRPWLIYCAPFVTAFFMLSFTKIGGNAVAGILVSIGYILSHAIWNICWTANRNLLPVLTDSPDERTFLSGRLAAGSCGGKMLASWLVPTLSTALIASVSGVTAYTLIALIAGCIFMLCYVIHYAITKGYEEDVKYESGKAVTFKDMAKSIVSCPPLIAILFHDAFRLVAYLGVPAAASYYCKIVLQNPGAVKTLLFIFYLGGFLGSLLSKTVAKKLGSTKKASFFGVIGFMVVQGLCYFVPANTIVISVMMGLAQFFFVIAYGLTSNLYAMCGAYSEYKTGKNTRGVIMAFCSLAIKLGIALRGLMITFVLSMINYDPNGAITAAAQSGIKILYMVAPVVVLLISLIPLALFKLDDDEVIKMEEEIRARNTAQ